MNGKRNLGLKISAKLVTGVGKADVAGIRNRDSLRERKKRGGRRTLAAFRRERSRAFQVP